MSSPDGSSPGQAASLGEALLRLIPRASTGKSEQGVPLKPVLARLISKDSLPHLAFVAVLAALCGTGVLFLLNAEVKDIEQYRYSLPTAVLFVVLLVIYRVAQNRLIKNAARAIEVALDHKRQLVVADVLKLSLRDIELLERSRLRDGIAANYGSLSQTIVPIISGAESLILLVFMFAYVVSLSLFAGGLSVLVVGLTVVGYLNRSKQMETEMATAAAADARFRALTDAISGGSKELQLSLRRRLGLEEAMATSSSALANGRSASASHFADLIATGTTISYLMAGAVVFVMPLLTQQADGDISRIVVAVIFLLGPIGSVVQTVQQFTIAQYCLSAINGFELDVASRVAEVAGSSQQSAGLQIDSPSPAVFKKITMRSVRYVHTGNQAFAIDDIDLTLQKGEIVFLTGGNGSGKTTLLRVLTGLYPRTSGGLQLNGQEVAKMPPQDYRELFSGVFADFYIFDRPFGLDEQELSDFSDWLKLLGIRDLLGEDLTKISADHLSTGQRKRVALALALAEQRPILVLDEWAADQDPETRKRFYEEILPSLKVEGRTIFAITHDEQYFHLCDRRLHMIEGQFQPRGLE